jgi:molybdate/tungstate transport system ATP-binding protein
MIAIETLAVRAGSFALNGISLVIPTGHHGFLMGKTGSGKTTLLEAVCGLKPAAAGRILLMGQDVTSRKPAARGIGYVPQDGALFPSMTVREHLAFALTIRHWKAADIEHRVGELAAMLGLEELLSRRPQGLSGGEAQRVALGRALANRPHVLCLDEPLSALDEDTRAEMCGVLQTVRQHTGVTILHVTHSLADARKLADRIFLLRDGQVSRAETGTNLTTGGETQAA